MHSDTLAQAPFHAIAAPLRGRISEWCELPPTRCCCGVEMTEGRILNPPEGEKVYLYRHSIHCPEALAQEAATRRAVTLRLLSEQYIHTLPPGLDGLEAYRTEFPTTGHGSAVSLLLRWAAKLETTGQTPATGVALCGAVGAGKTTLLLAFARDITRILTRTSKRAGFAPVEFIQEQTLWLNITRTMSRRDDDGQHAIVERLSTVPVLIIDNLGGQSVSTWWVDTILFHVINTRNLHGLPVFATTKYPFGALAQRLHTPDPKTGVPPSCAPDLADRLREMLVWCPIQGESHRQPRRDF